MSRSILHTVTGKAVTAEGSCDMYLFVEPTVANGLLTETFLGKLAQKLSASFVRDPIVQAHSSPIIAPSVLGMPQDIAGVFATTTFQVNDGVIMKLAAKRRAGLRRTMSSATLFIRTRASAAAQSIRLRPVGLANVTFNYLEVMGNFDIISLAEAESLGARVSQATRVLSEQRNVDGLLEFTVIAPETEAPVVGQIIEGADAPLMTVQRRRIIEEV